MGRDRNRLVRVGVFVALAVGSSGYFISMHWPALAWAHGGLSRLGWYWKWLARNFVAREALFDLSPLSRLALSAGFVSTLLVLTGAYLLAVNRAERDAAWSPRVGWLLVLTAIVCVPMILAPHLLSSDLWDYIFHARVAAVHDGNPFIQIPIDHPDDQYLQFVGWRGTSLQYGPAWLAITAAMTSGVEAVAASPAAHLFAHKLLAVGLHIANGWLIWTIAARARPDARAAATIFYLFNPVCLIELAGNGHNEALLVFFLLLGVRAYYLRGQVVLATLAFTLAVLTKIYALPVLALFTLCATRDEVDWRRRLQRVAVIVSASLVLIVVLYARWWEGIDTLSFLRRPEGNAFNSLASWYVREVAGEGYRVGIGFKIVWLATVGSVGVYALARARDLHSMVTTAGWFGLALCVASWEAWPWYAVVAVGFAALSDSKTLRTAALVYATGILLATYGTRPFRAFPPPWGYLHQHRELFALVPIYGFLAHAALSLWRRRR